MYTKADEAEFSLKAAQKRIRELEAELAEDLEKSDKRIEEARAEEKRAVDNLVALRRELVEARAELQVRDNSANEVLRILREATGKRDFHSEMEAAEYAAKMLADARLAEWLEALRRREREAALREARQKMHRKQTWEEVANMLTDMADAIAAERDHPEIPESSGGEK